MCSDSEGFWQFAPKLIVPGHGDPGGLDIALRLQEHMHSVKRGVTAPRASGQSVEKVAIEYKPKIMSAYPDWQHPEMLDLQIHYVASKLVQASLSLTISELA